MALQTLGDGNPIPFKQLPGVLTPQPDEHTIQQLEKLITLLNDQQPDSLIIPLQCLVSDLDGPLLETLRTREQSQPLILHGGLDQEDKTEAQKMMMMIMTAMWSKMIINHLIIEYQTYSKITFVIYLKTCAKIKRMQ